MLILLLPLNSQTLSRRENLCGRQDANEERFHPLKACPLQKYLQDVSVRSLLNRFCTNSGSVAKPAATPIWKNKDKACRGSTEHIRLKNNLGPSCTKLTLVFSREHLFVARGSVVGNEGCETSKMEFAIQRAVVHLQKRSRSTFVVILQCPL